MLRQHAALRRAKHHLLAAVHRRVLEGFHGKQIMKGHLGTVLLFESRELGSGFLFGDLLRTHGSQCLEDPDPKEDARKGRGKDSATGDAGGRHYHCKVIT